MKKLTITIAALSLTLLAGCATPKREFIKENAKTYSLTKSVYCGASAVQVYAEFDDFIAITCDDGSTKTIFLDEQ